MWWCNLCKKLSMYVMCICLSAWDYKHTQFGTLPFQLPLGYHPKLPSQMDHWLICKQLSQFLWISWPHCHWQNLVNGSKRAKVKKIVPFRSVLFFDMTHHAFSKVKKNFQTYHCSITKIVLTMRLQLIKLRQNPTFCSCKNILGLSESQFSIVHYPDTF